MRPSRFRMVMFVSLGALVMAASSPAQTVKTLYSFSGTNSSGNPLWGTLTQARNAQLYGTTFDGVGSVFAITASGKETQPFTFGADGTNPAGGLTLGTDGNFYGTTAYGGGAGYGVLFKLSPTGKYTVLHEFQGGSDGASPYSPPIQASDLNFYGTTFGASSTSNASTVYRYEMNGTYTVIHNLTFDEGEGVVSHLVQGSDGHLYGTAGSGGNTAECGTVFKMSTSGEMIWTYVFNCGFALNVNGYAPESPLVQAADGNFYGITSEGGWAGENAGCCGVIFKITPEGQETLLYTPTPFDGFNYTAGLTLGTDGNLYGATAYEGTRGGGTIFQISLSGTFQVLYDFGLSGEDAEAAPVQDTNGVFYGTTYKGGRDGFGTVYSLNMGLAPFVTFVLPAGKKGQTAQILGQGLTGTTSVTFNGVAATKISVVSDTYITAVVPSGATTGVVVVTSPSGTLTSNRQFLILP